MEKISEFWDHIKERLSNPFVSSFIISWVFTNWKITLGLLWYDKNDIPNLVEFVNGHSSWWVSLILPLLLAIAYIGLAPFVKMWISALQTLVTTWTTNRNLRLAGEARLPIDEFMEQRKLLKERRDTLEKYIVENKTTQKNYDDQVTANGIVSTELAALKNRLNEVDSYLDLLNNLNFMNGVWNWEQYEAGENLKVTTILIDDNMVYLWKSNKKTDKLYEIRNFMYNRRTNHLFFTFVRYGETASDPIKIFDGGRKVITKQYMLTLSWIHNDLLEGTMNVTTDVKFKRQPYSVSTTE